MPVVLQLFYQVLLLFYQVLDNFDYYTSTDFSLYKSNSIYFADSLKITVKRLFPCNTDYLPG